ncbi:eno [Acrasis kona]|uniref:Eno n=1 Tax=Acrasis kona TaxID=1008807 RepID=A0AAW2ZKL8_9EUKA
MTNQFSQEEIDRLFNNPSQTVTTNIQVTSVEQVIPSTLVVQSLSEQEIDELERQQDIKSLKTTHRHTHVVTPAELDYLMLTIDDGGSHYKNAPNAENLRNNIEEFEELVLTRAKKYSYSFKRSKEREEFGFQHQDYYSRGEWTVLKVGKDNSLLLLESIDKTGGPKTFEVELSQRAAKSSAFKNVLTSGEDVTISDGGDQLQKNFFKPEY